MDPVGGAVMSILTHWLRDAPWKKCGITTALWLTSRYIFFVYRSCQCAKFVYILKPFTVDFPQADIHELLAPDLLHQIIKGTFKDHLVDWVMEYIDLTYDKAEAERRLADIDRR
jgi:hypothetical protein